MMSPFGFGGMGMMSPFGYGYGVNPTAMIGITVADMFLQEQRRQAYMQRQIETARQLGQDQNAISALEQQLAQQTAALQSLEAQIKANPASASQQIQIPQSSMMPAP